jgi:putative excisionase
MSSLYLDKLFEALPTHLEVKHVATILGKSTTAVYELLRNGDVPAYKIGGSWLILRDEVREAIENSSNQHVQPPAD